MGKQCSDVLDIVPETVVLAFDITGITDPKGAKRVAESKEVTDAIRKELAAKGKKLIEKHFSGKEITEKDAIDMLKGAGSKLLDNRKKEVEKRLKCAYENSPLGVWIDKNEWVLYVFVPLVIGAAAGGAAWMYHAKTGDIPAGMAASMANVKKTWDISKLGKISIGTEGVKFVPSKREVAGKTFAKFDFERVDLKIEVGGGAKEDKFTGASAGLDFSYGFNKELKLTLGTNFTGLGNQYDDKPWIGKSSLKFNYTGSGAASNLKLSLGGDLAYDRFGLRTGGVKLGGSYTGKLGGQVPFSAGVAGHYNHIFRPGDPLVNEKQNPQQDYGVMFSFGIHWK